MYIFFNLMGRATEKSTKSNNSGTILYRTMAPGKGTVRPINKYAETANKRMNQARGSAITCFNRLMDKTNMHQKKMTSAEAKSCSAPFASHGYGRRKVLANACGKVLPKL